MHGRLLFLGFLATAVVTVTALAPAGAAGAPARTGAPAGTGARTRAGSYVLTATNTGASYAPTYTGNGYLGVRVPPTGQGYAGGTVPTQSEVAGLYAQPPGMVQQRANVPTWSTLAFGDGGRRFSLDTGTVTGWRQSIDLHAGVITTTARWRAPDGHVTDLRYAVFTDRARPYVGVVRLQLVPHWSGTATVTDLLDGTPATLTNPGVKGFQPAAGRYWETVRTQGTGIVAGLASTLRAQGSAVATTPVDTGGATQTAGQRLRLPVRDGQTYTVEKYVGVITSQYAAHPAVAARAQSAAAAVRGYAAVRSENDSAWARLWAGRIDILGNQKLATEVKASEFYLWSSTRAGVDWSISPAGLSSNGYDGHIFWDAETWMFPSLLAQHPDLASGIDAYRFQRLAAAQAHAKATGYRGARFPWESALNGTEQIPPPVSVNSEGLYEQHITADIALAQWQYYLATGDRGWLAAYGWPVISQAATFWASRVTPGAGGSYHILGITGPDEENPDVNDEVYTNRAAAKTLLIATQAARVLGARAPSAWTRIAHGLVILYDQQLGIHPEFAGYQGQMVKQADVTMLQYPWGLAMPAAVAQRDINYYVPRTDPLGPSMSDAINSIDTAALGSPGCASYVYTERSIEPFIRDVFDQFSETSTGGAFTFTTGIGGFLQEFLYGYSGLRWNATSVGLDPSLTAQLGGVVLHQLRWHGRVFSIAVGPSSTRVWLDSGSDLPITVGGQTRTVALGRPLTIPTRRPDLVPSNDLARCRAASASSAQPGADPLAAVDGSPATEWQSVELPATLTVPLGAPQSVSEAALLWGRQWPPQPGTNIPPPPGPVQTLRATSYDLLVSTNGRTWTTVAQVRGKASGLRDVLSFPATRARYLQVRITAATHGTPPMLQELTLHR